MINRWISSSLKELFLSSEMVPGIAFKLIEDFAYDRFAFAATHSLRETVNQSYQPLVIIVRRFNSHAQIRSPSKT